MPGVVTNKTPCPAVTTKAPQRPRLYIRWLMFSGRVLLEVVDPGVSSGRSLAFLARKLWGGKKRLFLQHRLMFMRDVSIGAGRGRRNGSDLHKVTPTVFTVVVVFTIPRSRQGAEQQH